MQNLKVFWSWQSDTKGKIGRHFIREALELAISELNEASDLDEAEREIELDHDRKGVPGSPDLANVILEKISASDVFVADVTPVGAIGGSGSKRLINSNVAIELGFALSALTDRRMIMVMNEHFGSREDLPFDLRHKAGPVMFRLPEDADKKSIDQAHRDLVTALKIALKEMKPRVAAEVQAPFVKIHSIAGDPSRFLNPGKSIVPAQARGKELFVPDTPLFYVRVTPRATLPQLARADAMDLVRQGPHQLQPLYPRQTGGAYEYNEFGVLAFDASWEDGLVICGVQLFLNREVWAFDSVMLSPHKGRAAGIPWLAAEKAFAQKIPGYLRFAVEKLSLAMPFDLSVGAAGIKGYPLHYRSNDYGWNDVAHILDDNVEWAGTVSSLDPATVDGLLLKTFETFFDAAGVRRPQGLYQFPGQPPGSLPRG